MGTPVFFLLHHYTLLTRKKLPLCNVLLWIWVLIYNLLLKYSTLYYTLYLIFFWILGFTLYCTLYRKLNRTLCCTLYYTEYCGRNFKIWAGLFSGECLLPWLLYNVLNIALYHKIYLTLYSRLIQLNCTLYLLYSRVCSTMYYLIYDTMCSTM